jgi:hypothetical protein
MTVRRPSLYLLLAVLFTAASSYAASTESIQLLRSHREKVRAESKSKAKLRATPNAHSCDHISPIACGATENGSLQAGDCVLASDNTFYDQYSLQGEAGLQVIIDAKSTTLDMYLVLIDPAGAVAAEDDDGGDGTDSRITYTLDQAGTWTIIVNSFLAASGSYTVSVTGCTIIPPCTKADVPLSCNATTQAALGTDDCTFPEGSYYESFSFAGTAGQVVTIDMRSTVFDTLVALFDPSGEIVDVNDDGPVGTDSQIVATLGTTGTYTVIATSFEDGPTPGAYSLSLACTAAPACSTTADRLCLNGRFLITTAWKDFSGNTGTGKAVQLTPDTGTFWFFNAENLELMIKALDGRPVNGRWWIFYGALSNVEYTITVVDTETGATKTYTNPPGTFASRGDTNAF